MRTNLLLSSLLIAVGCWLISTTDIHAQPADRFYPGQLWLDTDGRPINAHGGGILRDGGTYYWYGEHKGEHANNAYVGVTCYSSRDLYNWQYRGVAFAVNDSVGSPTERGCILERPKVIYCQRTGKYVMYFHLELKGQGYRHANVGIAIADSPVGPFRFVRNGRPNAKTWPVGYDKRLQKKTFPDTLKWWTPEWREAIKEGMFLHRDYERGQMARDMQLFVDDDGRAYHIFSSEDNLTIHIAELTDDYLHYTGRYTRVDPAGQNEAPTLFKRDGRYYMITSGCTGWAPNAARLFTADNILGPWTRHPNPCRGEDSLTTFHSQGTFILPLADGQLIFMADRWRPENPIDGRYIWLPVEWEDGLPVIRWKKKWKY